MKEQFSAHLLTVYVGEQDQYHGGPLYVALVEKLKASGIQGVTVVHGIEGFGSSGHIHTERIMMLFDGLPIIVTAVDSPERIAAAMPLLDEMIAGGLVTVQDVQATRYSKDR